MHHNLKGGREGGREELVCDYNSVLIIIIIIRLNILYTEDAVDIKTIDTLKNTEQVRCKPMDHHSSTV